MRSWFHRYFVVQVDVIHFIGGPRSLLLHRNEWNRLQKRAGPPDDPSQEENEYLKGLIEKSQAWIKSWPDSEQGVVAKKAKQKENQRAEQIARVKAFSKKKVNKNTTQEAIEKAKQSIFDESCYGKKLLSALLESKTLEERDVQIVFMRKEKQKEADERKQTKTVKFCTFDLDKNEAAHDDYQKCLTTQIAKENKETFEKQKADAAKAKQQEKLADLENAKLVKYLLDREQEAERKLKYLEKQLLEEYAAEKKKTNQERAKREAEYNGEIEACQKEQVKLNFKIKKVLQEINKSTQDPTIAKKVYETVEKCQEEEKKRYDNFIENNTKTGQERADEDERAAQGKAKQDRDKRVSVAEVNKKLAEYVRQRECSNKCFCHRQCFMTKSENERNMEKVKGKMIESEIKECSQHDPEGGAPKFCQRNRLVSALRRREQAPTPWTGSRNAHVHFAKAAEQVLKECKYKAPARKVVDEYRRNNGFDASTLAISNY